MNGEWFDLKPHMVYAIDSFMENGVYENSMENLKNIGKSRMRLHKKNIEIYLKHFTHELDDSGNQIYHDVDEILQLAGF